MRGLRLPRKRRFQVGGATPGTFGAAPGGIPPIGDAVQGIQNRLQAAGVPMTPGAGASWAQAPPGFQAPPPTPQQLAIAQQGMGALGPMANPAFANFAAQFGPGGIPPGAGGAVSAPAGASLGAAPGMPPGAGGMGMGMGAGPGLAAAGPAGNLAALRAAMMRRRGAVAAPGTGMAGSPVAAQVTGGGPGATFAAAPGFKRGGKVGRKAAGGELEGDTPRGVLPSNWKARQWGERDRSASDIPQVERRARGGVIAKRPKAGPKVSIAVGISRRKPIPTPSPYDMDAGEEAGSAAPGMAGGGKWIAGAIKHPGALRKQLGVKGGEKIPAGKLAKAAKAPGKLGQRARLAETLSGFHKAKGGECVEERTEKRAKGGLHDRAPGGLFASNQDPLEARGAPEKRRPVTGRYGEKERAEAKARGGMARPGAGGLPSRASSGPLGGGMPLNKRGIRTASPEERRPVTGNYGQVPGTMRKAKGGRLDERPGGLHTGTSQEKYRKPVHPPERRAKGGLHWPEAPRGKDERRGGLHTGTGGDRTPKFNSTSNLVKAKKLSRGPGGPSLSFAAGGAAKQRRGFPNTIAPPEPKRLAKGGKVRGGGIAQRGLRFQGIF